jgi:hypothetical protein
MPLTPFCVSLPPSHRPPVAASSSTDSFPLSLRIPGWNEALDRLDVSKSLDSPLHRADDKCTAHRPYTVQLIVTPRLRGFVKA